MHSGLMSLARCTNAEKSGFATGKRTEPTISPPASLKRALERRLGVVAGTVVGHHRVGTS